MCLVVFVCHVTVVVVVVACYICVCRSSVFLPCHVVDDVFAAAASVVLDMVLL